MITTSLSPFEQCYVTWPDIVKYGPEIDERDVLNLSQTSMLWHTGLLENSKLLAKADILPFIAFLKTHKITSPQIVDLTCFQSCTTFFDISLTKIEKIVEISLFLHQLNDVSKTILQQDFKKQHLASIFTRVMKSIKTDEQIIKKIRKNPPSDIYTQHDPEKIEKFYKEKFIHYLIVTGQFAKATHHIKKDGFKFKINDCIKNPNYTLIHAPFLISSERVIIIRNIFKQNLLKNFNKKNITITTQNLAKRIHMPEMAFPRAFFYFFAKLVMLSERDDSQMTTLHTLIGKSSLNALGLTKHSAIATYRNAKDFYLKYKIEDNLKSNNFETAGALIKSLFSASSQELATSNLLKSQINRHLLNDDLKNGFDLLTKLSAYDINRNSIAIDIAKKAIHDHELDFALAALQLVNISPLRRKDDPRKALEITHEKDKLYLEIACKQSLTLGYKTFKLLSYPMDYIDAFCLNAAEIIDKSDISKVLDLIANLKIEVSLKVLNRLVEKLFKGASANSWFHYAAGIKDSSKQRYVLHLLFTGLQEKQHSALFCGNNDLYHTLMIKLEEANFQKCLDLLFNLPTKCEQHLLLYRIVDYFYPNKDMDEWIKSVSKIADDLEKRKFLNNFITNTKLIGAMFKIKLLEIANVDATLAFDIINAHPDKKKRLTLFIFISNKINLDEDAIQWMKLCDLISDPIERRQFILDKTGK